MTVATNVQVLIQIDGEWVDYTSRVRAQDRIRITRGRPQFGRGHRPAELRLSLKNHDGLFSPRNPGSPLYGKLRRYTPIRVRADDRSRFNGYIPVWPVRSQVAGKDVWVPIIAYGPTQRMGASGSHADAKSAYRRFLERQSDIDAWWPMEEGPLADGLRPVHGGEPLRISRQGVLIEGRAGSLAPWLGTQAVQLPNFVVMQGATVGTSTNDWTVDILYRIHGAMGEGLILTLRTLFEQNTTNFLELRLWGPSASTPRIAQITYPNINNQIGTTASIGIDPFVGDTLHHIRLRAVQSGGNIQATAWVDGAQVIQRSFAGNLRQLRRAGFWYLHEPSGTETFTAPNPVSVGHLVAYGSSPPSISSTVAAARGHQGETASARISRIVSEEGETPFVSSGASARLGPQPYESALDVLADAAAADGGMLLDRRGELGIVYIPHGALLNATPDLTLDYGEQEILAYDLDEDEAVSNVVTVQRRYGSEATVEHADGPLGTSTQGKMLEQVILGLNSDLQARHHAGWIAHESTWDEPKLERLTVDFTALAAKGKTSLLTSLQALDTGDVIRVTNLPDWAGAKSVDWLVDGYTETIESHRRYLELWGRTIEPYRVGVLGTARLDAKGFVLDYGIGRTTTRIAVYASGVSIPSMAVVDRFARTSGSSWGSTPSGYAWTTSGPSTTFSTDGSGIMTIGAAPAMATAMLDSALQWTDAEVRFTVLPVVDAVTGGRIAFGAVMRVDSSGDGYYLRCAIGASHEFELNFFDLDTGGSLGSTTVGTWDGSRTIRYAAACVGTTLKAKVWHNGDVEPDWQHSVTNSKYSTGAVWLRGQRLTDNTNNNLELRFDDFQVAVSPLFSTATPYEVVVSDSEVMTVTAVDGAALTVVRGATGAAVPHVRNSEVRIHRPLRLAREAN